MAAYHDAWECVVEQCVGVRRMLSNKRLAIASLLLLITMLITYYSA